MAEDTPLIGPGNPTYEDTRNRLSALREKQFAEARDRIEALELVLVHCRPYIEEGWKGFGDPDREGAVLEEIDQLLSTTKSVRIAGLREIIRG